VQSRVQKLGPWFKVREARNWTSTQPMPWARQARCAMTHGNVTAAQSVHPNPGAYLTNMLAVTESVHGKVV
jgi:hypothetical protein